MNDGESLEHRKGECKYDLVFIRKYHQKVWCGALRHQTGGFTEGVSTTTRKPSRRGAFDARPCTHAEVDSSQVLSGPSGGIAEREECDLHCSDLDGKAEKLHG